MKTIYNVGLFVGPIGAVFGVPCAVVLLVFARGAGLTGRLAGVLTGLAALLWAVYWFMWGAGFDKVETDLTATAAELRSDQARLDGVLLACAVAVVSALAASAVAFGRARGQSKRVGS